jgi:hypothetical protein
MKKLFFNFINLLKPFPDEKVIVKGCDDNSGDKSADLFNNGIKHNSSDSFCHCPKGDCISQREYAALYAKACLYRMLAYELAEKYNDEMFNTIEAVRHIDGENI